MHEWQAPAAVEHGPAEHLAPEASPRAEMEATYHRDALGLACASEIVLRGLRDLLEQGGSFEDFYSYVQAIEAACNGLRTAATGLQHLQTAQGVA